MLVHSWKAQCIVDTTPVKGAYRIVAAKNRGVVGTFIFTGDFTEDVFGPLYKLNDYGEEEQKNIMNGMITLKNLEVTGGPV